MKRLAKQASAFAVALSLAALPLAGCGSPANTGTGAQTDTATSAVSQEPASNATPIDTTSWTTMRDALAHADSDGISYSYNDKYFVCVFKSGGSYVRTVSQMDKSKETAFADLDMGASDYATKLTGVVGDFKLISAQDITSQMMSQAELDAFVGKTGQGLLDAGFVFQSYFMYGGEQTAAEMGRDCFMYTFTFDKHIDESQTEDGGASINDAKVTEAQGLGNISNAALDPELVETQV